MSASNKNKMGLEVDNKLKMSPPKKMKLASDTLPQEEIDAVTTKFWQVTDRKQREKSDLLVPDKFHEWGIVNDIVNKSTTLNKIVKSGDTTYLGNPQHTLGQILDELDLPFSIHDLDTFDPNDKVVSYDVQSIPRWSFYGVDSTKQEAINKAALRGIDFFATLSL